MPETLSLSQAFVEEFESSSAKIIVRLSKAPIDPTANSQAMEDIVQADFEGYGGILCLFEPCEVEEDDYAEMASQEIIFVGGEDVEPQTIYYAYALYEVPGQISRLLGIYEFPEPVRVVQEGQEISTGAWRVTQIP